MRISDWSSDVCASDLQIFSFAVAPNYLDLYPEIEVSAAEREAFASTRTGVLVGEALMKRFGWKVGQKIPLQSTIFPNSDGSKNWAFDIVGVLHNADDADGGWNDQDRKSTRLNSSH